MTQDVGVRVVRVLTCALLIVAVLGGLSGAVASAAADPVAPVLTATGPTTAATDGDVLAFAGRLTVSDVPVAGAVVALERRLPGGEWSAVTSSTTDADGAASLSAVADGSAEWRLHHPGDATAAEASSVSVVVPVRFAVSAAWAADAVRVGRRATVRGVVAPASGPVRLERRVAGRWRLAKSVPVQPEGAFRVSVRPDAAGWERYRVVRAADPTHLAVAVTLPRLDVFRLHTYVVRTRGHVVADVDFFAARAAQTYADPRGWAAAHHRFARVRSGGDFTLVLAQARFLPAYSSVCSSLYSCRVGRNVVINQTRWRHGSPHFPGDLATYRAMLVNHETGHWLGRPHAFCRGAGRRAPVMQQQSKGMQGCRPNPWPLPRELRAVG